MSLEKKEVLNELYDAALITLGAVGVSVASEKLMKDKLGVTRTPQGIIKLVVAIALGAVVVKYLQKK